MRLFLQYLNRYAVNICGWLSAFGNIQGVRNLFKGFDDPRYNGIVADRRNETDDDLVNAKDADSDKFYQRWLIRRNNRIVDSNGDYTTCKEQKKNAGKNQNKF